MVLDTGAEGRAAVPSGASTGAHEAVELRDNDKARFDGKGVRQAIANVKGEIRDALIGQDPGEQVKIDRMLLDLDGTPNKGRIGANAILAVSLAVAKAAAAAHDLPLYRYLGGPYARTLPVPMMNIINGGKHADNPIDFQEIMIQPVSAGTIADAVRIGAEVFVTLKKGLSEAGYNTNVGDEGGFAPNVKSAEEAFEFVSRACERAGYRPGEDITFALDAASTEFFKDGRYVLEGENKTFDAAGIVRYLEELCARYPIVSIEDGCAEDDWDGWALLTKSLGSKVQLVGDDLFVTNPHRLRRGIEQGIGNAILVKVNQIGTLSETFEAVESGAPGRVQGRDKPSLRRNGGHNDRRSRGGHQLRSNQDRLAIALGSACQIQPAHSDRRATWRHGALCRPRCIDGRAAYSAESMRRQ